VLRPYSIFVSFHIFPYDLIYETIRSLSIIFFTEKHPLTYIEIVKAKSLRDLYGLCVRVKSFKKEKKFIDLSRGIIYINTIITGTDRNPNRNGAYTMRYFKLLIEKSESPEELEEKMSDRINGEYELHRNGDFKIETANMVHNPLTGELVQSVLIYYAE
jgi:hypothetical protein